uniref:Tetratricopeptide repeat n=1 Tax=Echinococcus granulosus TaxID=6210 RepID=A0A068WTL1_ECHGR|nr:tetratricopeptide repeat [Echinococcus granulosus]
MRNESCKVAEELDIATVLCSLIVESSCIYEGTLTFPVGCGCASGIPKIIDDAVDNLSLNSSKVTIVDISSLSEEDKHFFNVDGCGGEMASLNVNLVKVKKLKEVWNMGESEKISLASMCKTQGNGFLQANNLARALRAYKRGIQCLEGSVSVKPATHASHHQADQEAQQLYVNLLTNAALCLLKIVAQPERVTSRSDHQPISDETLMRHCIAMCEKALGIDADNAKALYRMAQAQAQLKHYSEAISIGKRAVEALKTKKSSSAMVEKSITDWKQALCAQKRDEYEHVRSAFLKRATELRKHGRLFADDGSGDANRLHFDDWSNDLADNVMSIHEELEAFGEKMPDPKAQRSHTEPLQSLVSQKLIQRMRRRWRKRRTRLKQVRPFCIHHYWVRSSVFDYAHLCLWPSVHVH